MRNSNGEKASYGKLLKKNVSARKPSSHLQSENWDSYLVKQGVSQFCFEKKSDGHLAFQRLAKSEMNCLIFLEDRSPSLQFPKFKEKHKLDNSDQYLKRSCRNFE